MLITRAVKEDFFQLAPPPGEKPFAYWTPYKEEYAQALIDSGPPRTFTDGSAGILCVCGISILWRGVGQMWMFFDRRSKGRTISLVKAMKQELERTVKDSNLRRVFAYVDASNATHVRFALFFDFKVEGYLPQHGPDGSDCYLMGRNYHGRIH